MADVGIQPKDRLAAEAGLETNNGIVGDADPADPRFSVFCFRDGILAAVEFVNMPSDHLSARKILAAGIEITRERDLSEGFSLRASYQDRTQPAAV